MEHSVSKNVVLPAVGVTDAERYLARLCKRSFLSMWSYPVVFRDQGRKNDKGDGKELCDLLVVFENHVFIFSDKDCEFGKTGNLELDWSRWYRKAVLESSKQVFAAERWIREFPQKLFLDRQCKIPFPIKLPSSDYAIFHRIIVAHNGSIHCQELMGGSGSFMLDTALEGEAHLRRPFTIGQINSAKGYVHVFDDTTLNIVMRTLDTITDFTSYIKKKEQFLLRYKCVVVPGEEELLTYYLKNRNNVGEHDFIINGNYDVISLPEGLWARFINSPERLAQVEADQISYAWDELIEKFAFHAMTGTQYFTSSHPLRDQEMMFRFMAREPRTRRRILAKSLRDVLERSMTSRSMWEARVLAPASIDEPCYVFVCVKRPATESDDDYRNKRMQLLSDYCHVAKIKWPSAKHIVGIATESGQEKRRSEDLMYLDVSEWNSESQAQAVEIQERMGILKETKSCKSREYEYPVDHMGILRKGLPSRNFQCECGSGKRFRNCHGKAYFPKSIKSKSKLK
jgi:hypothetical protein